MSVSQKVRSFVCESRWHRECIFVLDRAFLSGIFHFKITLEKNYDTFNQAMAIFLKD
jgi:hypothetical protein